MTELRPCWIDYETQSACDLKKCGSYVYAQHPSTRAICAAILYNDYRIFWTMDPHQLWMPPGIHYEHGYQFLWDLFHEPLFMIAHNVDFERPISEFTLKLPPPPGGWRDTMDQTLMRGLPAGADAAGSYLLGMGKDIDGYKLMMATCKPKRDGTMPELTAEVMQKYIRYNFRDVDIQKGITDLFGWDIAPEWENRVNQLHRSINHRGIQLDVSFAETLKSFDEAFKTEARAQTERATNGEVKGEDLTRRDFILNWLRCKGLHMDKLDADHIEKVLEADENGEIELSTDIYAVLTNRLVVSRAALSKVETALRGVCADGRLYALLKYWGARTGRWSGMRVQLQNVKRPNEAFDEDSLKWLTKEGLEGGIAGVSLLQLAIRAVETNDRELFEKCTIGLPPYELLSSLVRAIFVPKPGHKLIIGDFAQVEARGLLWWAEDWEGLKEHLDYDAGLGPDVYCTFASTIYRKTVTKKEHPKERQAGKVGQLACLAEGTLVLTDSGWKRIETVTREDLVWDGDAWVQHEGIVRKGIKPTVRFNDVRLTLDHLVQIEGGRWTSAGNLYGSGFSLWAEALRVGNASLMRAQDARYTAFGDRWFADHDLRSVSIETYDIRNAGPQNRFQAGPFLVHNCGYQGSVGAVRRMAYANGIDLAAAGVDEITVVNAWRTKYPRVVDLWYQCDAAFRRAIMVPNKEFRVGVCTFTGFPGRVEMRLPSGRVLTYMNARLEPSMKAGFEHTTVIAYDSAVKGFVKREEIYGGKIVENGVQAICRDLLADAMLRIDECGDDIVLHVHDEVVIEAPDDLAEEVRDSVEQIMKTPPEWAKGFPLNAEPEIVERYGK